MPTLTKLFTPGPWRFDDVEMKIKGSDDVNYHTVIANVSPKMNYSRGMRTQTANALLMTQSPEMYELLSMYVDAEKKRIAFSETNKIPYKESEQFRRAMAVLKKAVPHGE